MASLPDCARISGSGGRVYHRGRVESVFGHFDSRQQ